MLVQKSDALIKALTLLNENTKGIVFVVEADHTLCGALTDGDIRRALLNGANLQDIIEKSMNKAVVYAYVDETEVAIIDRFNYKIKIIPIVDRNLKIVDYMEFQHGIKVPVAEPYLHGNEFKYVLDALLSTWISSNGKYIGDFEKNFSSYCDCRYGVATSNGTTALHLALLALGIGDGDEVIVPDLTFAATINSVLHAQATPVIVDIEQDSWCIDPVQIEKAITPKTKAIIPVHLYGQPCNMAKIMDIANRYGLYVVEDCAEAHGAEFAGKKVGSFGNIGCFSFFGNKVITTGEGGMCVTNDHDLDDKMRVLRDHGMSKTKKYWHDIIGYNYRMTNIQAAIGLAQLENIDEFIEKRDDIESLYNQALKSVPNIELQRRDFSDRKKIAWLVSVLVPEDRRDFLLSKLKKHGIDVRPFFYPLGDMDIYKKYVFSNDNSRKISKQGINLPTVLGIEERVIQTIQQLLNDNFLVNGK